MTHEPNGPTGTGLDPVTLLWAGNRRWLRLRSALPYAEALLTDQKSAMPIFRDGYLNAITLLERNRARTSHWA